MNIPLVVAIGLLALGWACVFQARPIADWQRRQYYQSSKFVQRWPLANIVLKSWYPTYLRGMGEFLWLIAVLLMVEAAFRRMSR